METVPCNLCASTNQELLYEGQDWSYGSPGRFRMVRCPQCGLIFLNPRPGPEEIGEYYPDDYEPYLRSVHASGSALQDLIQRVRLRSRVRVVTQLVQNGRLLDVGCGSGGFLREMRRLGWEVQGVEINAKMAQFVRTQLELDVLEGTLESASFPGDSFDIVTMWDTLEHVHDPLSTLKEAHRILRPGGYLICSVPNAASLDAGLFGRYWIGLDFPRHLYVFSPSTLAELMLKAGLLPGDPFCFYGRYTTFALSLSIWFNAHVRSWRWQRRVRSMLLFPLFRYLSLPFFLLLDNLKRGAIITVPAHKAS